MVGCRVAAVDLDGWLLLIHIVAGAAWFGGGVILLLLSSRARQQGQLFAFVQQMEWVGPRIGPPVSIGLVGTGVWMVIRSEGFEFSQAWIIGGLVGFGVLLAIGAGFHGRQYRKINAAAAEHGENSNVVADLIAGSFRAAQIEVALLLVVFWLMVAKPGL